MKRESVGAAEVAVVSLFERNSPANWLKSKKKRIWLSSDDCKCVSRLMKQLRQEIRLKLREHPCRIEELKEKEEDMRCWCRWWWCGWSAHTRECRTIEFKHTHTQSSCARREYTHTHTHTHTHTTAQHSTVGESRCGAADCSKNEGKEEEEGEDKTGAKIWSKRVTIGGRVCVWKILFCRKWRIISDTPSAWLSWSRNVDRRSETDMRGSAHLAYTRAFKNFRLASLCLT